MFQETPHGCCICRDWTAPSVPSILTADNVTIINTAGQPLSVYNPFREYKFPVRFMTHLLRTLL
jgi:hypothetical protein